MDQQQGNMVYNNAQAIPRPVEEENQGFIRDYEQQQQQQPEQQQEEETTTTTTPCQKKKCCFSKCGKFGKFLCKSFFVLNVLIVLSQIFLFPGSCFYAAISVGILGYYGAKKVYNKYGVAMLDEDQQKKAKKMMVAGFLLGTGFMVAISWRLPIALCPGILYGGILALKTINEADPQNKKKVTFKKHLITFIMISTILLFTAATVTNVMRPRRGCHTRSATTYHHHQQQQPQPDRAHHQQPAKGHHQQPAKGHHQQPAKGHHQQPAKGHHQQPARGHHQQQEVLGTPMFEKQLKHNKQQQQQPKAHKPGSPHHHHQPPKQPEKKPEKQPEQPPKQPEGKHHKHKHHHHSQNRFSEYNGACVTVSFISLIVNSITKMIVYIWAICLGIHFLVDRRRRKREQTTLVLEENYSYPSTQPQQQQQQPQQHYPTPPQQQYAYPTTYAQIPRQQPQQVQVPQQAVVPQVQQQQQAPQPMYYPPMPQQQVNPNTKQ